MKMVYGIELKKKNDLELFVCFIGFDDDKVFVSDYRIIPYEFAYIKPMAHKCCIDCTSKEVVHKIDDHNFCNLIKNFMYNSKITIKFLNINTPYWLHYGITVKIF